MKPSSILAVTLLVSCFLCSVNTYADDSLGEPFDSMCQKANTTSEMVECTTKAYKHWDKILNNKFAKAKSACQNTSNAKTCTSNLLKAQKSWMQYKESMAKAIMDIGGGSMHRVISAHFLATETKRQAELLGSLIDSE